jgi:hypothetical protein
MQGRLRLGPRSLRLQKKPLVECSRVPHTLLGGKMKENVSREFYRLAGGEQECQCDILGKSHSILTC